jgi:hypothetical protein
MNLAKMEKIIFKLNIKVGPSKTSNIPIVDCSFQNGKRYAKAPSLLFGLKNCRRNSFKI